MNYFEVSSMKQIAIWGVGGTLNRYIKRIDPKLNIVVLVDSDKKKIGKLYYNAYRCISPEEIRKDCAVIIAVLDNDSRREIEDFLIRRKIKFCHIYDAVQGYIEKKERNSCFVNEKILFDDKNKLRRYIDCAVSVGSCNLRCEYCYLKQLGSKFKAYRCFYHSPQFIRKALSKKRLDGVALINFCGDGETLLCDKLLPIVHELIQEGHYISIVTNGTISEKVKNIVAMGNDCKSIFLKISFHYNELKRIGLLDEFKDNVNLLRNAGCSISVELVPDDSYVPYVDEIKEYSLQAFGALPQLTVVRDLNNDHKILSNYAEEEYRRIWGEFHSPMFEYKMNEVGLRRFDNCMAGDWSLHLNLETGDLYQCVDNPWIDNIYEDLSRPIRYKAIYDKCCLPYCINCHSYLALGTIPDVDSPDYYTVRDRKMQNGEHWVSENIKRIFEQRLDQNNNKEIATKI